MYVYTVPAPASVVVTSSDITAGDPATLNCTVEWVQAVTNSDLSAVVVDVQLSGPDGSLLSLSGPNLSGTTFTYTTRVDSFGRNESGVYTCGASIRPKPSLSKFLTGPSQLSGSARVTAGIKLYVPRSTLNFQCCAQNSVDNIKINIMICESGQG